MVEIGSVVSEKKIFEKVYRRMTAEDGWTSIDGNSSHGLLARWAKKDQYNKDHEYRVKAR